jgi:hypothetical protein
MLADDINGLRGAVWLLVIAGSLLLYWCARTAKVWGQHLWRNLGDEPRVDVAYICVLTGQDRVLEGIRRHPHESTRRLLSHRPLSNRGSGSKFPVFIVLVAALWLAANYWYFFVAEHELAYSSQSDRWGQNSRFWSGVATPLLRRGHRTSLQLHHNELH